MMKVLFILTSLCLTGLSVRAATLDCRLSLATYDVVSATAHSQRGYDVRFGNNYNVLSFSYDPAKGDQHSLSHDLSMFFTAKKFGSRNVGEKASVYASALVQQDSAENATLQINFRGIGDVFAFDMIAIGGQKDFSNEAQNGGNDQKSYTAITAFKVKAEADEVAMNNMATLTCVVK